MDIDEKRGSFVDLRFWVNEKFKSPFEINLTLIMSLFFPVGCVVDLILLNCYY